MVDSDQHWIRIKLQGTISNRDALGARLWIEFDAGTPQIQHFNQGGFLSQPEGIIHVGLGNDASPVNIDIRWPNGEMQYFKQVPVNQLVALTERKNEFESIVITTPALANEVFTGLDLFTPIQKVNLLDIISSLNDELFLQIVASTLNDEDTNVRQAALFHLGNNRTAGGLALLLQPLMHPDPRAQLDAIVALW